MIDFELYSFCAVDSSRTSKFYVLQVKNINAGDFLIFQINWQILVRVFLVFLLSSQVSLWKRSGGVMNVHEITQEWDGKFWPLGSYFCL